MCGIAGIIDTRKSASEIRDVLVHMTDTIRHRGPDDEGHLAEHGFGMGMRRLSIIDVEGGHQPISNETGEIHVICNGEIYNFAELRANLIARGHTFSTGSDAEVIVHLYEDEQEDCLKKLRGMFGLAIWDRRRRRLILARDRLGKKPLFVARLGDRCWFGSEMKSLLAAEPKLAEENPDALAEYLQFGYLAEPNTFYRHIHKLPAASLAVWERGRWSTRRYWDFAFAEEQQDWSVWREQLDALLEECVRVRLRSDVPLGVFLSGGIDSSAIVAYAHRAGLRPLKTFTIGFDQPAWDESADALRVARHFGTEHYRLELSQSDLLRNFDETLKTLVRHFDEPFGDASALPTYHVSRLAKEHVTVILSGDGGDELFAGYSSYRGAQFAQWYRRLLPGWIGGKLLPGTARYFARQLPGKARYAWQRVAKICQDSALPFLDAYRDKISICTRHDVRSLLTEHVWRAAPGMQDQYLTDRLWRILDSPRDMVSRLTELDIRWYMLDDILVKVDRMSMAHSLEVRSPLLDHHLVEFAATVPSKWKLRRGQSKFLLKEVLRPQLPTATRRKRKQGFSVPLREWFRGALEEPLIDTLGADARRLPSDVFQQRHVQRLLDEHRRGTADHSRALWLLLVYATWRDTYPTGAIAPCAVSQVS